MISVCIATYNGENYIKKQLISILKQLDENDEIIVSDDSSTDKTVEIIEGIKDKRIKILKNNKFKQASLNFENALKHAKGDYIFLSDQDDVWIDNKLKEMLQELEKSDLVISDAIVTDENLNVINNSLFNIVNSGNGIIKNILKNTYYGCCMAFRKEVLEKSLPFPKNKEIGHDLWLGLIAEEYFRVKFLDKRLIYFRRHQKTLTSINKSKRGLISKIFGRVIICYYFFKKIVLEWRQRK